MHVGTKSTLHKKPKNEIHRRQGRAVYVDDRLLRLKLSTVMHKISQNKIKKKKIQAEWSCEFRLSFVVAGAKHNRHQRYKAERCRKGKKYLKEKYEERRFLIKNILGMVLLK